MKSIWMCLLLLLTFACSHKNNVKEANYSSLVSFQEEGVNFSAEVSLPKGFKDKLPLVIVVHEWWGRTPYVEQRVKMLNDAGYAAMAVDLYGGSVIVDNPTDAQKLATPFYQSPETGIKRLEKYVKLASKNPHVNAHKVYVIGYCFGGTQALNFARSNPDVKGVVSFHGGLASSYPTKENLTPQILVLHGGADPMVPPKEVKAFEREMKSVKAMSKIVTYPGAKHAFTNPKATAIGKKFNLPIAYDKKADEASWKELLKFLR